MSRLLPIQPDLEHIKNEAKALHKAHARGDASACGVLRRLKRFADATDSTILSAALTLTEVHFALALEYGFKSWDELRRAVLNTRPLDGSQAPPQAHALRLPDPPPGGDGNRFARGYHMAVSYCGAVCNYDTVAGDSGLAFILQADSKHTPYGAKVKELDLGYWPLNPWGAMLRLDFLGGVYGIPLRQLSTVFGEYRSDPAAHFARHHRSTIVECLHAERPVVALVGGYDISVVTGMDDGTPPLLGQLACSDEAKVSRLAQYPWIVVVTGDMIEPMDRAQADAEALAFACSLHHERFIGSIQGSRAEHAAVNSGGKASFALWSEVLRDGQRCGPAHYSANIVGCTLPRNRRSAPPPYLRAMSERHNKPVASHLHAAAGMYEDVLGELAKADTSKEVMASADGREALANLVDRIAAVEAEAVNEMERAVAGMK